MQSGREDTLEERYAIKLCFKLGKNAQKRMECFRVFFDQLAWIKHQFLSGKEGMECVMYEERCGMSKEVNTPELIGQRVRVSVTMLRFLGSSGRDSVGRRQHSSNWASGISIWTMHQSTIPSLSQTIWPRWSSRQFLSLPIVQALLPVTFGYSLSSEAVVMRQLRRWKRLWRRSLTRSRLSTSIGPSRSGWKSTTSALHPKRLFRRGLEFHVCTINKSAHTKKVWKLI